MCEKTYVFGCGCKSRTYLSIKDRSGVERHYCGQHFNPQYAVSNHCNRNSQLTQIEGPCSQCGAAVKIENRHAMGRNRLFLCRACTTLRAKTKTRTAQAQKPANQDSDKKSS